MTHKWIDLLFRGVILNIFLIIFILMGFGYIYLLFTAPLSVERLQLLISIDAVAATLAGLLFYASYASWDEKRKSVYFQCAENFLHAFIFLFGTAFLRGCLLLLDDFAWYGNWRLLISNVLKVITFFFFIYGIIYYVRGLKKIFTFILEIN